MSLTPQVLSLIISGLALVIILFHVLIGAIRGLKKSVFRLAWVAVSGVVCLLLANVIAKALVNLDYSFLNLSFAGEKITTLPNYIEKMAEHMNPDIANMIADNPDLMNLFVAMATSMLSLVVFEVLFWVSKLLLWPIWAIFSHVFIGKKNAGKDKKQVRKSKHSGFGALVGVGLGLLICVFTYIPLASVNSIVMQIEAETSETVATESAEGDSSGVIRYTLYASTGEEEAEQSSGGIITKLLGNNAEFLTIYEDSIIGSVFKYTGMNALQVGMSNMLTTSTFKGERISIQKEISTFAPIYKDYEKISQYNLNDLSKADIAEILPIVDRVQQRVFDSNLVNSLYEELAPYLAQKIVTDDGYFIKLPDLHNDYLNELMENVIRAFFGVTDDNHIDPDKVVGIKDISNDITKAIEVAELLNNADILHKVLKGEISKEYLKEKVTQTLGENIVNKFFEMRTVGTLMPVIVEPTIKYGVEAIPAIEVDGEEVKVVYTAVEGGITAQSLQNLLIHITGNLVTVFKNVDFENMPYVSTQNFSNLGSILDYLKISNVISTQTYNSLINYGETYGNKYVDEMELNTQIKDVAKDLINTLDDVGSFERELGYFGEAYQIYLDSEEIAELEVCKMLDKIKPSIFYTANEDNIISKLNELVDDYIDDSSLPISTTNISTILNSIKQVTSFEAEYNSIEDVYHFITELIEEENPADELLKEENLQEFGEKLDAEKRKQSKLLSDANIKLLLESMIDGVELPAEVEDYKATIKANINSITSFAEELPYVAKALNISKVTSTDRQKLVDIGAILDDIKASKLFGNIIPTIVTDYIDKEIEGKTLDESIEDIIAEVKQNISNNLVYSDEFGYVYDTINADISSIASTKTFLQTKLLNADGTSKSSLITVNVLYDVVISMAEEIEIQDISIMSDVTSMLEQDKQNAENLITVISQLENLENEIDEIKQVPASDSLTKTYLTELGDRIDKLVQNYNLILNHSATTKIGDYIAQTLNSNVQSSGSIPQGRKDAVALVYGNLANYKTDNSTNYKQMFTDYADALEL